MTGLGLDARVLFKGRRRVRVKRGNRYEGTRGEEKWDGVKRGTICQMKRGGEGSLCGAMEKR